MYLLLNAACFKAKSQKKTVLKKEEEQVGGEGRGERGRKKKDC